MPDRGAVVVARTTEFDGDLAALLGAGFRLDAIWPADEPSSARLSFGAVELLLERSDEPAPLLVRADSKERAGEQVVTPGGTVVEFVAFEPGVALPDADQSVVVTSPGDDEVWVVGRAGMLYRDLLPGRWGGRFIASHISIPDGGPVPDFVHYHRIRFQLIFVKEGWVRVVYEDQGDPFVMHRGDCVLQPPEIRHRVLESSANFQVVEIGCPAVHATLVEHGFDLPTPALAPDRDFGGQRFVHHVASGAAWEPWRVAGFECRDSGIAAATGGLAGVQVVRPTGATTGPVVQETEFELLVVLRGACRIEIDGGVHELVDGSSAAVPSGVAFVVDGASSDLELLDVVLPARPPIRVAVTEEFTSRVQNR